VRANATIRFGGGFTIERLTVSGTYRIKGNPTTSGFFMATVATAVTAGTHANVVQYQKDALTGQHWADVEIHDLVTGALVDGDFTFVMMQRS